MPRAALRSPVAAAALLLLAQCNPARPGDPADPDGAPTTAPATSASAASSVAGAPVPSASATPSSSPSTSASPPRPPRPPTALAKGTVFEASIPDDWLPRATTTEVGLDGAGVDALVRQAVASDSDSLLLIKDGRVVVERTFGRPAGPIETRSGTKSIASLAVLALIADGKIASLDVPLSTFFPEFATGEKAKVTLRHVLTHSTGLDHGATDADALNAQANRLAYARARPVKTAPGSRWAYSNEATQLLSGVIAIAAGEDAEAYVRRRLFAPMGIKDDVWRRDRSGNVQTYYGVQLTPRDMARLGLFLLDEGRVDGKAVLPAELIREAVAPSAVSMSYGLLFWLRLDLKQTDARVDALAAAGFAPAAKLRAHGDRTFRSEEDYFALSAELVGAAQRGRLAELHRGGTRALEAAPQGAVGFYAVGGLGQRLAVYPRARIVAVRQHRRRPGDDAREAKVTWRRFFDDVEATDPDLARP